ncbi:hypothetical protein [Aliamphritea spongicola]|nr:hypothetical protein [Aliamphritea spongicola]
MSREEYIEEYCRHLKGLGISNNIIEDVAEDKNSYTPIFEMSCFMKASWNDVVDLEDSSGWLSNTLNMLQEMVSTGTKWLYHFMMKVKMNGRSYAHLLNL